MDRLQSANIESAVRYYCRKFPAVFDEARGAELFDTDGCRFVDFFGGAGALNYGHNHPQLVAAVVEYLKRDGILHSLDLCTRAKQRFLEQLQVSILQPRQMEYRAQFPGPTGANAVEAAVKLARKVTGRTQVVAFTNSFHGVTMGALALTSSGAHRRAAGLQLLGAIRMPYDGFLGNGDELRYVEQLLTATGHGQDPPAAFIVETVQGEGGLNTASTNWLQGIQRLARQLDALLIVDDILAGCGRTGTFFSFEGLLEIQPDVVCLSKSLAGLGLPLSLVLIHPDRDIWKPGEHNGTFRGNNLAFVAGAAAMRFWQEESFLSGVQTLADRLQMWLEKVQQRFGDVVRPVGRGTLRGIGLPAELAARVQAKAYENGLVIETSGADDSVLKMLPPLNVDSTVLDEGLAILESAIEAVVNETVHEKQRPSYVGIHP